MGVKGKIAWNFMTDKVSKVLFQASYRELMNLLMSGSETVESINFTREQSSLFRRSLGSNVAKLSLARIQVKTRMLTLWLTMGFTRCSEAARVSQHVGVTRRGRVRVVSSLLLIKSASKPIASI